MPIGPYKNFAECVRKVAKKKNAPSDPEAYCGWLQNKIEGKDPILSEIHENYEKWGIDFQATVFSYYRFEGMLIPLTSDDFMTREKAEEALKGKNIWKDVDDAVVLDDHRWAHMWANTITSGNKLFISRQQLRRLHDKIVDELSRRGVKSGLNHKTPMNVGPLELGTELESFLKSREAFMLDPEFINVVGSAVSGGEDAQDLDIMVKSSRKEYGTALLDNIPSNLKPALDLLFGNTPQGPYIPAFELWAVPVQSPKPKEPKYNIHPMAPIPPAAPSKTLSDPRELMQDSYYVFQPRGERLMVHRKENEVIAFNEKLDEVELPEKVHDCLLGVEKPRTFILDGFLAAGVYYMIDLPWWGASEHIGQTAEQRRTFLSKIPQSKELRMSPMLHFENRAEAAAFLKDEKGPFYLVPGSTQYPADGNSDWRLYHRLDLADPSITTALWDKMASTFEVNAVVVGVQYDDGKYTFTGAVGPVGAQLSAKTAPVDVENYGAFVKINGETYTILG